jgi:CHAT domain-containing protein
LIVANPDFNMSVSEVETSPPSAAIVKPPAARPFQITFAPLDSTEDEAKEIAKLLPGSQVLMGSAATETALKQVHSPSILHVATHGFFYRGAANLDITRINGEEVFKPSIVNLFLDFYQTREGLQHISSLSRAGIALAGANHENQHAGDGVLTAFEMSGLDLRGTKLVTLSACETGIGDVEIGNGVYGLRRSLVLAGAESQVMSLWKVDNEITREMMIIFYTNLRAGEGRSNALRQARLSMLRRNSHPYYWASFIQSGDWRKIEGISNEK